MLYLFYVYSSFPLILIYNKTPNLFATFEYLPKCRFANYPTYISFVSVSVSVSVTGCQELSAIEMRRRCANILEVYLAAE